MATLLLLAPLKGLPLMICELVTSSLGLFVPVTVMRGVGVKFDVPLPDWPICRAPNAPSVCDGVRLVVALLLELSPGSCVCLMNLNSLRLGW